MNQVVHSGAPITPDVARAVTAGTGENSTSTAFEGTSASRCCKILNAAALITGSATAA